VFTQTLKQARRTAIAVVGITLLALGVVMLVAPGPGWLVIFIGLSVLGVEFVWAHQLLKRLKQKGNDLSDAIFRKPASRESGRPGGES
jgi:trk system potassium uptake protein TrkH